MRVMGGLHLVALLQLAWLLFLDKCGPCEAFLTSSSSSSSICNSQTERSFLKRTGTRTCTRLQSGPRKVEKVDPETGQVLETFPTVRAACKALGKSESVLYTRLRREMPPVYDGFEWRYSDDSNEPRGKTNGAVEKIDLETGQVLEVFPSAFAAVTQTERLEASSISRVLHGERRSAGGFFWRYQGSDTVSRPGRHRGARVIQVEKLCLQTGNVLETFDSIAMASRSVGTKRLTNLPRTAAGYFWREKGSTATPQSEEPTKKRVEKVCYETHKVVGTYDTLTHAANSVSRKAEHISGVLRGRSKSAGGFFFRYEGSDALPPPRSRRVHTRNSMNKFAGPVEMLCPQTQQVLVVYDSCRDAAKAMRVSIVAIEYAIKNGSFSHGYYWRFQGAQDFKPKPLPLALQPVEQVCPETHQVVATFSSVQEAADQTGTFQDGIILVVKGKQKRAGSFFWRPPGSDQLPVPKAKHPWSS